MIIHTRCLSLAVLVLVNKGGRRMFGDRERERGGRKGLCDCVWDRGIEGEERRREREGEEEKGEGAPTFYCGSIIWNVRAMSVVCGGVCVVNVLCVWMCVHCQYWVQCAVCPSGAVNNSTVNDTPFFLLSRSPLAYPSHPHPSLTFPPSLSTHTPPPTLLLPPHAYPLHRMTFGCSWSLWRHVMYGLATEETEGTICWGDCVQDGRLSECSSCPPPPVAVDSAWGW